LIYQIKDLIKVKKTSNQWLAPFDISNQRYDVKSKAFYGFQRN